jgi:hypothetical protein
MTEKKDERRRIDCPLSDFEDAFVIIPKHWTGAHCVKRDEAIRASREYKNVEITNLSISLYIVDGFENIPGIEGDDPSKWQLDQTPLIIISWLSGVVLEDFLSAYNVPKNS